jgi:hypothetical protein
MTHILHNTTAGMRPYTHLSRQMHQNQNVHPRTVFERRRGGEEARESVQLSETAGLHALLRLHLVACRRTRLLGRQTQPLERFS